MVIILSVGFNFEQVMFICLFLFSVMLAHDIEFGSIVVDTFLLIVTIYSLDKTLKCGTINDKMVVYQSYRHRFIKCTCPGGAPFKSLIGL